MILEHMDPGKVVVWGKVSSNVWMAVLCFYSFRLTPI